MLEIGQFKNYLPKLKAEKDVFSKEDFLSSKFITGFGGAHTFILPNGDILALKFEKQDHTDFIFDLLRKSTMQWH